MIALLLSVVLVVPFAEPPPLAVSTPADVSVTASRIPTVETGPPPVPFTTDSVGRECVGALNLLTAYSPGWDVHRMARLSFRESRCKPDAYNRRGRATGLLQVTPITYGFVGRCLGELVTRLKLTDPVFNVRAAACLWREDGYRPWQVSR